MAPDPYTTQRAQLVEFFGQGRISEKSLPDGRHVFKVADVPLPPGCRPVTTAVHVVYGSPGGPPEVLVTPGIVLASGRVPRNLNPLTVDGEACASFSANLPWAPDMSVGLYVMRRIWRFRQPE